MFNRLYYHAEYTYAHESIQGWYHRILPYMVARLDAPPFYLINQNPQDVDNANDDDSDEVDIAEL